MSEEKGRKVLVAVDGGDESSHALTWCLTNILSSGNSKDTLILVYAKPPLSVHSATDATGYLFAPNIIVAMEKYGNEMAKTVMDKATKLCKNFNDKIKVEIVIENGDPRDAICDVADRLKVDFLVVGSHGYGAIKRAFIGSVSSHCAQNAKCPVLIVKKPKPNE